MQQNYATARVGAKRRVWNQGSGEDVGGDGAPIWEFLSGPSSPRPCAEMEPFLWEGAPGGRCWARSRGVEPFQNSDQETSPNIITYWWLHMKSHISISPDIWYLSARTFIHSDSGEINMHICPVTADRSSFKYMWLQRNHQASCLCYKWASEFLDSYWLFKPFDFNLVQLLTWKTGVWKWEKQPWDSNPCCRADRELSADHEYGPGFVYSHRVCLKFHIQLSFFLLIVQ